MPPKRATSATKPAAKEKAPARRAVSDTKVKTTATKRKAEELSEEPAVSTAKRVKKTKASEEPKPAPAKANSTKAASVTKAAAPAKATKVPAKAKSTTSTNATAAKKILATKAAPGKVVKKAAAKKVVKKAASVEDDAEEAESESEPEPEVASKKEVKPKKVVETEVKPKKIVEKKVTAPKKVVAPKPKRALPELNTPPTQKLQIFVFGEGSAGELGLGAKNPDGKKVLDVTRPRLNNRLEAIGVVQLAVGGMHCAALSADNKIFTWGVNDAGALGRETLQEGKMKDIGSNEGSDSDSDSDDEDSGLNPAEAEPREVSSDHFEEGTKFASLYASDSATFALTTTGLVYGWGTFRANDGILGFSASVKQQNTPALIPELKGIKDIATGTNHVLALSHKGKVYAWGAGEQSQLARRVVARTANGALVPREFGLQRKSIVNVATGDYHSFAIDKNGTVYSWGLNTFGQTGIPKDDEADDTVHLPTKVDNLRGLNIKQIAGGAHHTLSCTEEGEVLIWGRVDNHEGGMKVEDMPKESLYFDATGNARYLQKPLTLPNIKGCYVASGPDTCLVICQDGKAYSWGFSTNYQTGQGTSDDVVEATHIDNTAVRGKMLVSGGIGGQFGVLAGAGDA